MQPMQLLFKKYIDNQCTPEEVQSLLAHFEAGNNETLLKQYIYAELENPVVEEQGANWDPLLEASYRTIRQNIQNGHGRIIPLYKRNWFRISAVFLLIAGTGLLTWQMMGRKSATPSLVQQKPAAMAPVSYNRTITLPDESVVVLGANSQLDYPAGFTGNTREVSLTGEAYFDIQHNEQQPFIIHTGKVKTTVLGTAFTIKAFANDTNITITVTRGKVKVEDDKQVLAVLTPDQQVVYNTEEAVAKQQPANTKDALNWVKQDMVFESASFESIAEQISKRYDVHITFSNNSIASCPITVSFDGTETLEQVLTILCTTRNATYTAQEENKIVIDGKGCK